MSGQSVLISGQRVNSRTEALELYCKPRFEEVGIYAFSSPFASHGDNRWTRYHKAREVETRALPPGHAPGGPFKWLVLPWVFISTIRQAAAAIRSAKKISPGPWDCFVGIALVSTLLGLWLRKKGLVKRVVYYCLDYYIPPPSPWLDRMAMKFFQRLDRWAALTCDENWIISDRIAEGREQHAGLAPREYHWIEVPLGYDDSVVHHPDPDQFDPLSLGFVGSLSSNQGVDGVIEVMPRLLKRFPGLKLNVIGTGGYEKELRAQAARLGLNDAVVFHGFVPEEKEVLRRLSRCAVGLATWKSDRFDMNVYYCDAGKPKLYAMCGIPSLVSDQMKVSALFQKENAGRAIPYDLSAIERNLTEMLEDHNRLRAMRAASRKFAFEHCLARVYFDRAFKEMKP
jgi:glycosyltransferase involved in cell wall biosynthesis